MVVVQNFLDPQAAAELRERHGCGGARGRFHALPSDLGIHSGPKLGIKLEFRHDVVDESSHIPCSRPRPKS